MHGGARLPSRVVATRLLLSVTVLLGACADTIPAAALRLPESSLEIRAVQTRTFEAPSDVVIMAATIATVQDMEFNIDIIEKPLGVITASKVADADSKGQKTGLFFLDLLCAASGSTDCNSSQTADDEQRVTLTMVVLPSLARSNEYVTRITLQRAIYSKAQQVTKLERIDEPEIYQQIFDNLSKAIFIQVGQND